MKGYKIIFLNVILFTSFSFGIAGNENIPNEFQSCYRVYESLVHVIGRMSPLPPKFTPLPNDKAVPRITPTGELQLGKNFIEVCKSFGADSLNAMALVIGHELGHYYSEQYWAKKYGSAYADIAWAARIKASWKDMKEMGVFESQADEFGIFYSFLAGYDCFGIADELYDRIYDRYNFPAKIPGYPSLDDRKAIAAAAEKRIAKLIPIFETGKLLSILSTAQKGEFRLNLLERAGLCYTHIINEKYSSREIYNNLGVVHAFSALAMMKSKENPYIFPFLGDDESRLFDINGSRASGIKGNPDEERKSLIEKHLKDAEKYFKYAVELDEFYAPTQVNLVLTYALMGKFVEGNFYVAKVEKLYKSTKNKHLQAYAVEAEALLLAEQGKRKKALKLLRKAEGLGSKTSILNQYVMGKTLPNKFPGEDREVKKQNLMEELIYNKSFLDIINETSFLPGDIFQTAWSEDYIYRKAFDHSELFVAECREQNCTYNNIAFHQTGSSYNEATALGVKIGDDMKKALMLYGPPEKIIPFAGSTWYLYKSPGIIFRSNDSEWIEGWANYYLYD